MRRQLGAAVSALLDAVTKTYADTKLALQGGWSNTAAYAVNDVVTYHGRTYICTTAVAAAGASSFVGYSSYTSDPSGGPSGAVTIALPAGTAALDQIVGALQTTTAAAQTLVAPTGGALIPPSTISSAYASANFLNRSLFSYIVTATDVTNGYITIPTQAGTPINQCAIIGVWRNVTLSSTRSTTTTNTTPSITPGVASYIVSVLQARIGGGTTNTDTYAVGVTSSSFVNAVAQNTLNTNNTALIGYETLASGASTARAATVSQGFNAGTSYAAALTTSSGTNTAPDQASSNWSPVGDVLPVGSIQMYAGSSAPSGWAFCDGSSYLRTDQPNLFAAIGTAYGTVDGTHFSVPDLRSRVPVGLSIASPFAALGNSGGATTHQHTLSDAAIAEIAMAASTPAFFIRRLTTGFSWTANLQNSTATIGAASSSAQTGGAPLTGHTDTGDHTPPYQVVNFIIKL